MMFDQFITLCGFEVFAHHFGHEFLKGSLGRPAQLNLGLGRVAQQGFDFGGAEIAWVHGDDELVALGSFPVAFLVHAFAFPTDGHAQFLGGGVDEVAHAVLHAGGDDEIFGLRLLQHEPLHFNVVLGVAPIALGVQVAQEQAVLQAQLDARQGAGDLAGDEGFTADGAFVVEQDAVAGVDAVGLAVVDGDPVGVELGHRVGAARVEGSGFLLGDFLHQAVEFAGAGLVEAGFLFQTQDAYGLQYAQGAQRVGVGGVFGLLEAHGHVALRGEVVDFVGLGLLDDAYKAGAIGKVSVVQEEAHILFMPVAVEVVDAIGVEQAGAALDAVDDVALVEQEFGQVGTVLAGDAGDEGDFGLFCHGVVFQGCAVWFCRKSW